MNQSQNVVDSLPCRRQSFRRVSWKSAGDCMRNANKSAKIRYSTMVREVEKWSGIRTRDRITTKSWTVLPTGRPNYNIKFQWNRLITFAVILLTERQRDRQTQQMTDKLTWSNNLRLGGRNNYKIKYRQACAKRSHAGNNFIQWSKNRFFAMQGRHVPNLTFIGAEMWEYNHKNCQNFEIWP